MTVTPKLFLFSSHAETMAPMVRFFELKQFPLTPDPASSMVFDFFTDGQVHTVEARYTSYSGTVNFYNDTSAKFEGQLTEALKLYNDKVGSATTAKDLCAVPFSLTNSTSLEDPQVFKQQLYNAFGYAPSSAVSIMSSLLFTTSHLLLF